MILFDGLTKGFRYPGWRRLGARAVGDDPDDGAHGELDRRRAVAIAQRAALAALEPAGGPEHALREVFAKKRNLLVERLNAMGIRFAKEPLSTFYGWASLEDCPSPERLDVLLPPRARSCR